MYIHAYTYVHAWWHKAGPRGGQVSSHVLANIGGLASFPPRLHGASGVIAAIIRHLIVTSLVVNLTTATLMTWDHRPYEDDFDFKHQHFDGGQSSWHEAGRFGHAAQPGVGEASITRGTDRPTDRPTIPEGPLREGGQVGRESLRPPEFSAGPEW